MPDQALNFTGTGFATIPSLTLTGDFTIEFQIKFPAGSVISAQDTVFMGGSLPSGVSFNFHNGQARLFADGSDRIVATATARPGEWQHYALVREGGELRLYIDGILNNTSTWSGPLTIERLGHNIANLESLSAQLDDVRVWNTARSAEQIHTSFDQDVAASSPGLVRSYKFDGDMTSETGNATGTLGAGQSFVADALPPADNNLIVNGGFEQYGETALGSAPHGWTTSGTGGLFQIAGVSANQTGNGFYALGGWLPNHGGSLQQTIETEAGKTYTLTFSASVSFQLANGPFNAQLRAEVFGGNVSIAAQDFQLGANMAAGARTYTVTFTATGPQSTIMLTDRSPAGQADFDVGIDNVAVKPADGSAAANGDGAQSLDFSTDGYAKVVDLEAGTWANASLILLLGDSLTEGMPNVPGGYRHVLYDRLTSEQNVLVDFVGSNAARNPAPGQSDVDHQGYGGIQAVQVLQQINGIAAANPHDLALIMLGTNDLAYWGPNPSPQTVAGYLNGIFSALEAANPDVEILVATLPVFNDAASQARFSQFNTLLPSLVAQAKAAGINVNLVDFSSVTLQDLPDGVHPFAAGTPKWADIWMKGLMANTDVEAGTLDGEANSTYGARDVVGSKNNDRLLGDEGNNQLTGGAGNDYLDGRGGSNVLNGGAGIDTFAFTKGAQGSHLVTDFTAGDRVLLKGFDFASPAAASGSFAQAGTNVVFTRQGTSITFTNTTVAAVQAAVQIGVDPDNNLIVNGGFEHYGETALGSAPHGWTTSGIGGLIQIAGVGVNQTGKGYYALGGWLPDHGGSLQQTVETEAGKTYTLTFSASVSFQTANGSFNAQLRAEVFGGDTSIAAHNFQLGANAAAGAKTYTVTFTATGPQTTIMLTDRSPGGQGDFDVGVDNVVVKPADGSNGGSGDENQSLDFSTDTYAKVVDLDAGTFANASRILVLGDSLTDGAGVPGGYRHVLYDRLTGEQEVLVDFVGGYTHNPAPGQLDVNHQGYGGIQAAQVLTQISAIASANPHDMAMIMLGTNDAAWGPNPNPYVVTDHLFRIMLSLQAANPNVKILLGTLPYWNEAGPQARITAVNNLLPAMVAQASSMGIDVSLVNFGAMTNMDYYDGIHPHAAGERKWADTWLKALLAKTDVEAGTLDGDALSTDGARDVVGSKNNDRLLGDERDNQLTGGQGNDYLDGRGGSNVLNGGAGIDTFAFSKAEAGHNLVTDFTAGDRVLLKDFGFADGAAAAASLSQSGAHVVFSQQGTTITFANASLAAVQAAVQTPNLVLNGSFEAAAVAPTSPTYRVLATGQVGAWQSSHNSIEIWNDGFGGVAPTEGRNITQVDYYGGTLSQTIKTEANQTYGLTFDYAGLAGLIASSKVEVLWNNVVVETILPFDTTMRSYHLQAVGTGGNDVLAFRAVAGDTDWFGGLLDNVRVHTTDHFFYGDSGEDFFYDGVGNDTYKGGIANYDQINLDGAIGDWLFTGNADGSVSARHAVYGDNTLNDIDGVWFNDAQTWRALADIIA